MADDGMIYGNNGPFETTGRTIQLAELRTHTAVIAGKSRDLANLRLKVGDHAPACCGTGGGAVSNLFVQNYTLQQDGEFGTMNITLVEASSATDPYQSTATIDMQAVEKKLRNHPALNDEDCQKEITAFEATPDGQKYEIEDDGSASPQYISANDLASPSISLGVMPTKMKNENAIKYAMAKFYGIETYTVYLPVVEVVSQYLKLPGANVDGTSHKISGTVKAADLDKMGTYCHPPFGVAGFDDGEWFKTCDRFVQNANGSWTRTEQWTYTNDLRFKWIYDNRIIYQVMNEQGSGGAKES